MRFGRSFIVVMALAAAVAAGATAASAAVQQLAGGYVIGSFPTGDWGKIAGFGLALDATDVIKPNTDKWLSVRSNLGLLYNFSRTVDIPGANLGPGDQLKLETRNWGLMFGVGPELSAPNKAVTPFLFGTVGFDTYWTSSELAGTAGGAAYSAQHGDSRIAFAWGAGVGLRREVFGGDMTELSVEYRSGLSHHFLLPENVTSSGGAVNAIRSDNCSNQFIVRIGTVFGVIE